MKPLSLLLLIFLVIPIGDAYSGINPQDIENKDIVLLIDNSGSMREFSKAPISSFMERITGNRLAIISFGSRAKLLYPLTRLSAVEQQKAIVSLNEMYFTENFTDIAAGLKLALKELQKNWIADNSKTVVLISDGKIDLSANSGPEDTYLLELQSRVLPEYERNNIKIDAIAFGKGDLRLMQELAGRTGAKCFVAPNNRAVADILSVYSRTFGNAFSRTETDVKYVLPTQIYSGHLTALYFLMSTLTVLVGMCVVLLFMDRRKLRLITTRLGNDREHSSDSPTYVRLRDNTDQMEGFLTSAVANLSTLKRGLEDYWVECHKVEKDLEARYCRIVDGLLLLLDYFEDAVKEHPQAEVGWFYKKLQRLIEEEGISVINVREGSIFDSRYHKYEDERAGSAPRGTIVEVTRKGYYAKDKEGGPGLVLRPTEVIISSGSREEKDQGDDI